MYAFKWAKLNTTMFFAPDEGGGGSEAAPAGSGGGGDGAGSASETPSAAPPPSPSSSPSEAGEAAAAASTPTLDWSALGSSDDLDQLEIAEPPKAPPVPEEPKAPVPPPVVQPDDKPTQPATPTPPSAGTEGEARPFSASDPWRIAEGLEANRDAVVAHLAGSKFALSEAEVREIDTDVMTAIPKLLSKVFLESQVSMQKFLAQAVPGMVKQYNTVTSANGEAEKKFFDAHKALDINNPQHRAAAVRIATVYRQANPNIPLNQLIAEVGPMVMATLQMNARPQSPQTAQAAPRGGTPFRPAVNGGGGVSATPEPASPWAGLGQNYDE